MANFRAYFPELIRAEGGFVNHPHDPGGATKFGITLRTWEMYGRDITGDGEIDVKDIMALTPEHALPIYKEHYWDRVWGDKISSQPMAEILFDHAVNAGPWRATKMLQFLLNRDHGKSLTLDGGMGPNTLAALNSVPDVKLYRAYVTLREKYYRFRAADLVNTDPAYVFLSSLKLSPSGSARVFLDGWLNRVSHFKKRVSGFVSTGVGVIKANPVKSAVTGGVILLGVGLGGYWLYRRAGGKRKRAA